MREGTTFCSRKKSTKLKKTLFASNNLLPHHCEFCVTKVGLDYINEAIEKLREKHSEHMELYGKGNEERMTGEHETVNNIVII